MSTTSAVRREVGHARGIPGQVLEHELVRTASARHDDGVVPGIERVVARGAGEHLSRGVVRGQRDTGSAR